MEAKTHCH